MTFKAECPACKSTNEKQIVNEYNYIQMAKYFCSESRNKERNKRFAEAIKKLWQQDTGYFLRCKNCGFGFGYPFIGGDDNFYKIVHEQAGYPSNRWEYDMVINDFFKNKPPQKILDIGAGSGYFLERVNCKLKYALEGSETTRAILKKKQIKVYDDEKKIVEENKNSFDYVTMFQVLEHISDFENIIYIANQLLCLNAQFIISVPDCDAMIVQEKLTGMPDLFPNHINKWTLDSLNLVLQKFGFKTHEIIYEPPSIKLFFFSVYLRILYKATIKGSLASYIYKFKNRNIRISLLFLYSFLVIPRLIPYYKKLDRKGSFLLIALKEHELS